jgi:hypothetical protein
MVACPFCKSPHIRDDYRPAPFFMRIIGIRALLCDNCNVQFKTFMPLSPERAKRRRIRMGDTKNGKESSRPTKPDRKTKNEESDVIHDATPVGLEELRQNTAEAQTRHSDDLKRVTLSLRPAQPGETVAGHIVSPTRHEFQTQVFKLNDKKTQDLIENGVSNGSGSLAVKCSDCGSRNVERRRRTPIERAALTLTDHKAFSCRDCQSSFYARTPIDDGTTTDPGLFDGGLEPEPEG